jgi:hypothetical protein
MKGASALSITQRDCHTVIYIRHEGFAKSEVRQEEASTACHIWRFRLISNLLARFFAFRLLFAAFHFEKFAHQLLRHNSR